MEVYVQSKSILAASRGQKRHLTLVHLILTLDTSRALATPHDDRALSIRVPPLDAINSTPGTSMYDVH